MSHCTSASTLFSGILISQYGSCLVISSSSSLCCSFFESFFWGGSIVGSTSWLWIIKSLFKSSKFWLSIYGGQVSLPTASDNPKLGAVGFYWINFLRSLIGPVILASRVKLLLPNSEIFILVLRGLTYLSGCCRIFNLLFSISSGDKTVFCFLIFLLILRLLIWLMRAEFL